MAYVERERYVMLVHPTESLETYSMTGILSFFPGFINVQDALTSKISTLDANFLTIASDQVFRQKKFTLVKPTEDVTFMLLRASLKDIFLKVALIFGTTNLAYLLNIQTTDAKAVLIRENQSLNGAKVDVVQFSFESAVLTTEMNLPQKQ